jgi:homoserine O-succinyltransferase
MPPLISSTVFKRQKLDRKMFGVFDCDKVTDHPLVNGLPHWRTPHSRVNGVREADLQQAGYRILSRSPEAGVDIFVKGRRSLFVFLQGHPEYDATALFGEYRRDVRRFLAGERDAYPEMPHGCLDDAAREALGDFRARAQRCRDPALLKQFPAAVVGKTLTAPWCDAAARIYGNWLTYLYGRVARRIDWAGFDRSLHSRHLNEIVA